MSYTTMGNEIIGNKALMCSYSTGIVQCSSMPQE